MIALVFMCCGWSINWVKTILEPTGIPLHLCFLWDTLKMTIPLSEDKTTWVQVWAKKLLDVNKTTQENCECYVGTLISTTPVVWQAPLHYRALQRLLIISLKHCRNKSKSIWNSHPSIVENRNSGLPGVLEPTGLVHGIHQKPYSRSGWMPACLVVVVKLIAVLPFSEPGQNRRQGSTSTGWNLEQLNIHY